MKTYEHEETSVLMMYDVISYMYSIGPYRICIGLAVRYWSHNFTSAWTALKLEFAISKSEDLI